MLTEISPYEKQANDFLTATGSEIKIEYLKHDKYFDDDKEARDIYSVTLKRGSRQFTFNFGQSLNNSGIKIVNRNNGKTMRTFAPSKQFDKNGKFDALKFKLTCGWQISSCDLIVLPKPPTNYDILACLTKYDPGIFEDFCSEFGYDTDSIRAEKTYNAVKNEYMNVINLYSDTEIEQLAEVQ